MTNGGILEFYNFKEMVFNKKKLEKYSIYGFKVFEIKVLSNKKIFIGSKSNQKKLLIIIILIH